MVKWLLRAGVMILVLLGVAVLALVAAGFRESAGRTEATIDMARPPAEIYPMLVETPKRRLWIVGMTEANDLTQGGPRVGARSRFVILQGGQRLEAELELTALEPPREIQGRITSDAFEQTIGWNLQPIDGGTRVYYSAHTRYHAWLTRLLEPLFSAAAQKRVEQSLARLKSLLEAKP
jgi:hypothetical protein